MDSDLRAGLSDSTDNMCYVAGLRHECASVIPQANASFLLDFKLWLQPFFFFKGNYGFNLVRSWNACSQILTVLICVFSVLPLHKLIL